MFYIESGPNSTQLLQQVLGCNRFWCNLDPAPIQLFRVLSGGIGFARVNYFCYLDNFYYLVYMHMFIFAAFLSTHDYCN